MLCPLIYEDGFIGLLLVSTGFPDVRSVKEKKSDNNGEGFIKFLSFGRRVCGCLWMWWGRTAPLLPEGLAGELPGQEGARRRAGPWCWRNSRVWASPEHLGPGTRGSPRAPSLQTSPGVASTRRAASGPGGAEPRGAVPCRAVPARGPEGAAGRCLGLAGPGRARPRDSPRHRSQRRANRAALPGAAFAPAAAKRLGAWPCPRCSGAAR